MKFVAWASIVLLLPGIAAAANPSDGPSGVRPSIYEVVSIYEIPAAKEGPSRFWTKANCSLITLDAVAKSADMLFTMRNASRPGFYENDPFGRPFVMHGPVVAGVSQGLLFAGEVFTAFELNKHGHRKMAKILLLVGIGGNTAGIASSNP